MGRSNTTEDVKEKIYQAHNLLLNSKIEEAISLLREVISIDPEGPHAELSSGMIFYIQGNLREAISRFESILSKWPDWQCLTDVFIYLGKTYRKLATKEKEAESKLSYFKPSLSYLQKAIESNPSTPIPYLESALTYLKIEGFSKLNSVEKRKALNKAEEYVDRVLRELDPTNLRALITKANILLRKTNYIKDAKEIKRLKEEANALAESVISSKEADLNTLCYALAFRARAALEIGDYETAERYCLRIRELAKDKIEPSSLKLLIDAQRGMGKHKDAIDTCRVWCSIYPNDAWGHANLGKLLESENMDEALDELYRAVKLGRDNEALLSFAIPIIARIHEKRGEIGLALNILEKAPRIARDKPETQRLINRLENCSTKLEIEAMELENEAKKEREDFDKKAKLYLEASEIYRKLNDEKNRKWNLANYYLTKGRISHRSNMFMDAVEFLRKAETLFLDLGLRNLAFYCALNILSNYCFEVEKRGREEQELLLDQYIKLAESYLEKYKDFSDSREYANLRLEFCKNKSRKCRAKRDYDTAEALTKEFYELAEEAYNRFQDESFRKAVIIGKHWYWNIKAHKLEVERKFKEAAECYRRSAETIAEIDENTSYDEYANYYKLLALASEGREEFENNIARAIEFAERKGDERYKCYLLAFKYDRAIRFTEDLNERISYLEQALAWYGRGGLSESTSAKTSRFILLYTRFQKELGDKNYERAKKYLREAASIRDVSFPNIITSPDDLRRDEYLCEAYSAFSQGRFADATSFFERWLNESRQMESTEKYHFYRVLRDCSELLEKEKPSDEDLYRMEEDMRFIREKKLSPLLYEICSLVFSFLSLKIYSPNEKAQEEIKLRIISKIGREEVVKEIKLRLDVQHAIEELDWLNRLPPILVENFDRCVYMLYDVIEECKNVVIRDFYTLLENYLRVIVEFNAKSLWRNDWKSRLEKSQGGKPFESFTFGNLIQCLRLLKNDNATYCKDIPDDVFELLNFHAKIRNSLAHELIEEIPEFDVVREASKIMYMLLSSFPTFVEIIDVRRSPWYDAKILWRELPERIILYYEERLDEGVYYMEPISHIENNIVYPKIIVPASFKIKKL
jgi:tetratricopeptide (TPR) repeat protein